MATILAVLTWSVGPVLADPPKKDPWANIKHDPLMSLRIVKYHWHLSGFGHVAIIESIKVKNSSKTRTFKDLCYKSRYFAPSGAQVKQGEGKLLDVIGPGKTKTFENINEGFIDSQASRLTLEITCATETLPTGGTTTHRPL